MKNPNHPGDIIHSCLDELGVSVTEGAKALGVTRPASAPPRGAACVIARLLFLDAYMRRSVASAMYS